MTPLSLILLASRAPSLLHSRFFHLAHGAVPIMLTVVALAILVMGVLRVLRLSWTFAFAGLPVAGIVWIISRPVGGILAAGLVLGSAATVKWELDDRKAGGDLAHRARSQTSLFPALRALWTVRTIRRHGPLLGDELVIGRDHRGGAVRVPIGGRSGAHTLVVGASGSGKTWTIGAIAHALLGHTHGGVIIDPKGDPNLYLAAALAAEKRGRRLVQWSGRDRTVYNPYASGSDTELVDKLLAGEEWSEPHYLRQAQRYLGHAIRTLRAAGTPTDLSAIVTALDPRQLEGLAGTLPEGQADGLHGYLDSLTARQSADLAGVRDRLAVLAESDLRHVLIPEPGREAIDLDQITRQGGTVYFRLDADRRPLAAQMIGAAILQDLIALAAARQSDPVPTLVIIDEFAALDLHQVARLYGRGRSAGMSVLMGTQELADLAHADPALRDQVAGNLETLIAHRQNVPDSADFIAQMAGARGVWTTTQRTGPNKRGEPGQAGTRTRSWEYVLHPDQLKRLPQGNAAVITPAGRQARITRINGSWAKR